MYGDAKYFAQFSEKLNQAGIAAQFFQTANTREEVLMHFSRTA